MSVVVNAAGGGPFYLAAWSGDTKASPVAADKVLIYDSVAQDFKETTIGALLGGLDVLTQKGAIDCSADPNYPAADAGHEYRISVAGHIGGAAGPIVQAGDIVICNTDGTVAGTHAAVGANWNIIQLNVERPIEGPASSTTNGIAVFSDNTGTSVESRNATVDSSGNISTIGNISGDVVTAEEVRTEQVKGSSNTGGGTLDLVNASGQGIEIDGSGNVEVNVGYVKLNDRAAPSNPLDTEGLLYKKSSDDGIFWLPDSAGVEVDLTNPGLATATNLTILAKVNEAGGISKGQVVYISGATGQFPQVSLCDNTNVNKHEWIGLAAETKTDGQNILVRVGGQLSPLDTDGTGVPGAAEVWADGDNLYMSTGGLLTKTLPTSGEVHHICDVAYAHGVNGKLVLTSHDEVHIAVASGQDVDIRMGDSAGATKASFKDYTDTEVGSIDSDGNLAVGGTATIGGQITQAGNDVLDTTSVDDVTIEINTTTGGHELQLKDIVVTDMPNADGEYFAECATRQTVDTNTNGVGNVCYLNTGDGNFDDADADAASTGGGEIVLALEAGTGANKLVLHKGWLYLSNWGFSPSRGVAYVSTGAGLLTQTAPSGAGDVVKIAGHFYNTSGTAGLFRFAPEGGYVEIV